MSNKAHIGVGILVFLGVLITAWASIKVAQISAQDVPSPGPAPSPPPSADRRYYQAPVGDFRFSGEMVWRANGDVAAGSATVGPYEDAKAVECRSRLVSIAMSKAGQPLGEPHSRSCKTLPPEGDYRRFGHIEYSHDAAIASVLIIPYLDDEPTAVIHCPRRAPCVTVKGNLAAWLIGVV